MRRGGGVKYLYNPARCFGKVMHNFLSVTLGIGMENILSTASNGGCVSNS